MNTSNLTNFLTATRDGTIWNTVLFVQKGVADYTFRIFWEWSFGREWYFETNGNLFFQVKTPQDIAIGEKLFAGKRQFILTGTDVLKKWEVRDDYADRVIETIPSKEVWWCESTLSVFGGMDSLREMTEWAPPDIVYTRGISTLTEQAIATAYPENRIDIREVDGNTEAYVALESRNMESRVVCGTEFVQTGKSLLATQSYILRGDGIYTPTRDTGGRFTQIAENRSSTAQAFAENLTLDVNVLFAEIFPKN